MHFYANILNLYVPMVTKKIMEILAMNLPLSMIAPSHGVIWKNDELIMDEEDSLA